jgi:hypothetical protein
MRLSGIFPGLCAIVRSFQIEDVNQAHLRERAIVPDVSMVGETIANESQSALLNVLLDGIERFFLGHFHLCVRPARDFNDHVEDTVALICEERNVVEWRDD